MNGWVVNREPSGEEPEDSLDASGNGERQGEGVVGTVQGLQVGLHIPGIGEALNRAVDEFHEQLVEVEAVCQGSFLITGFLQGTVTTKKTVPSVKYPVTQFWTSLCEAGSSGLGKTSPCIFQFRAMSRSRMAVPHAEECLQASCP